MQGETWRGHRPLRVCTAKVMLMLIASSLSFVFSHGQPDSLGFISIDCGYTTQPNYTDARTGITYVADEGFIEAGLIHTVNLDNMQPADLALRYSTVRFFPTGTRNCYTLQSLTPGGKYYVRAAFGYGNYDTLNRPPTFDLYLGVNYWTTVSVINASTAYIFEMIAVSPSNYLHVCLVNIGLGTPFISGLDLRLLQSNLYPDANSKQSLVLLSFFRETVSFGFNRYHFGTDDHHIRYPDDRYDRIWQKYEDVSTWTVVQDTINGIVKNSPNDTYAAPSAVMRSVSTPVNDSRMDLRWSSDSSMDVDVHTKYFVVLYFAEVETLQENEFRQFDVLLDNSTLATAFRPEQMLTTVLTGTVQGSGSHGISLVASSNSKPPLISAMELYLVRPLNESATYLGDATAMMSIQTKFSIKRNWAGDPCSPIAFAWDGLNCTYSPSRPPRIIALDLSSSGLIGEIGPSFGQLTLLQHLNLSHNNLSGPIPDSLGQVPSLTFLDLSSNNLSGSVPTNLLQKSLDGLLTLRIDNNPNLCANLSCNPIPSQKKSIIKIVIPSVLGGLALLALLVALFLWYKGKCTKAPVLQSVEGDQGPQPGGTDLDLQSVGCNQDQQPVGVDQGPQPVGDDQDDQALESVRDNHADVPAGLAIRSFRYEELAVITDGFRNQIGEGGFGCVYSGKLENGTRVAVKKRSQDSRQGDAQFLSEVMNLADASHKNLVKLLGYCKDNEHLCIVYEYMAGGNLEDRLIEVTGQEAPLTWLQRLKIALDAAHGLNYLHTAFTTTVIHRDVKTRNILLTEKLDAKISDVGLARPLISGSRTHITSSLAGTPGYLDPEYIFSHHLSDKADVYSFGIVLLVLITARPAIFKVDNKEINIAEWVREKLSQGEGGVGSNNDVESVIDPRIRGDCDLNSVRKVAELAFRCIQREVVRARPTMSLVVAALMENLQLVKASAAGTSGALVLHNEPVAGADEVATREARPTLYYSASGDLD
ncbi:hypothetical protein ACP70R_008445 [Stipagrostis hirtigluma subsp. patula]